MNYPPVPMSQTVASSTIARVQEGQVTSSSVIGSLLKLKATYEFQEPVPRAFFCFHVDSVVLVPPPPAKRRHVKST